MNKFKGWNKIPSVKELTPKKAKAKVNNRELAIGQALQDAGIEYETQYKFHPTRRWRFDFLIPQYNIAIEYNGGQYTFGRHTRSSGYAKDLEKINEAQKMGYIVLQYTTDLFNKNGKGTNQIIRDIKEIIGRGLR